MKVVLSPMAGVNDKSFRRLCLSMGADVVFTEMISVNGLVNGNKKSFEMLPEAEENAVVQLFGNEPEYFSRAVDTVRNRTNWIDLNAACPVPKVVKHGYGAALMKNPFLVRKIVETLSKKGVKVSVKIRIGWEGENNFLDIARAAFDGGAFLISIHGRTVEQGYSGKADWDSARVLKRNLKAKIGVSGDIFTAYDAMKAQKITNADMILVARGAIGNPWIFREIKEISMMKKPSPVTFKERKNIFNRHLLNTMEEHGIHGIIIFRKFLIAYLKGLPNSHDVKSRAVQTKDVSLVSEMVNSYFDQLISCEQGGVECGNIKSQFEI